MQVHSFGLEAPSDFTALLVSAGIGLCLIVPILNLVNIGEGSDL
jgi:hypothetical protein